MKQKLIILFFLALLISCDKNIIEKPENLIKEKQMIDIIVDIHLAESTFNVRRYSDDPVKNSSSANFYYSILDKYNVPDTTFEKSYVYYASQPKQFEKMYGEVMNKLNELEQRFSGRNNEELEFGETE
jgi:hypothetical protein